MANDIPIIGATVAVVKNTDGTHDYVGPTHPLNTQNAHLDITGALVPDGDEYPGMVYEGGNTNKTKVVTVTDVAVLVNWTGAVNGQVLNSGAQTVYLGGADVTSSNGWPVAAGLREGHGRPDLYAVCATGETSTLIVWDEVV